MNPLNAFLSGAIFTACLVIAAFFLRFWRQTRDRFFILFAIAFGILAVERVVLIALSPANEVTPYAYLIRLLAFLTIIVAIIDKNRAKPE